MFLRHTKRFKDGKVHRYWSVVENRRVAPKRTVQQTLLYLGEINDSQKEAWCRAITTIDNKTEKAQQLFLFPDDRQPPENLSDQSLQLNLKGIELARPRQWGGCWMALELWDWLDFDSFWATRLPPSRKGTCWLNVLKTLVCYRLLSPGSEWRLHRKWFDDSAMADLLGETFAIAAKNTLYRCHDKLLRHQDAFFGFLRQRWEHLFDATFDVVLYDVTSTYFEGDSAKVDPESKKRFGYSRDKRSDCVQVLIALIGQPGRTAAGLQGLAGKYAGQADA